MGEARKAVGLETRFAVQELFDRYAACLDDGEYEAWPNFFTDACLYQIIPRENWDRGLPLATVRCESRGMLEDRVVALRETMMYEPRALRHLVSGVRVVRAAGGAELEARANYCVLETLVEEATRILQAGRYEALIEGEGESLRFRELACVFDSVVVPNSLVVPI